MLTGIRGQDKNIGMYSCLTVTEEYNKKVMNSYFIFVEVL